MVESGPSDGNSSETIAPSTIAATIHSLLPSPSDVASDSASQSASLLSLTSPTAQLACESASQSVSQSSSGPTADSGGFHADLQEAPVAEDSGSSHKPAESVRTPGGKEVNNQLPLFVSSSVSG